MITEKDLQLIEDFLNEDLSSADMKRVKKRLDSDPQFKAHVQIVRDLPKAIAIDTKGFKEDLDKIMQPSKSKPARVRRLPLRGLILAAAATIAVILAVNFLMEDSSPSQLYATHFTLPPENISVRDNRSIEESLTTALEAYSDHDHEVATENFGRYLADHPDEEAVLFFYSLSLMAKGDYQTAEGHLRKVEQEEGTYSTSAKWYLGLVYLKLEKLDTASEYIEQLTATQGAYQERAKRLLSALN